MLLGWGCDRPVSKFEVADALPKGDKVHITESGWRGAHPNKAFVGNPYTDSDDGSYGVFEGPILQTLETFMPGAGINLTGRPFKTILNIVRSGKPVLVWTTLEQRETFFGLSWTDEEGDETDWYENEHAVVLTGIEGNNIMAHDPHTGRAEHYDRVSFEQNWYALGCRAVTLRQAY
ncbi:C39 family peptidase [Lentibacillus amyloliquefaciens]|nr:C39 family peptidase [Lentibacillus amyloliquefaciens]